MKNKENEVDLKTLALGQREVAKLVYKGVKDFAPMVALLDSEIDEEGKRSLVAVGSNEAGDVKMMIDKLGINAMYDIGIKSLGRNTAFVPEVIVAMTEAWSMIYDTKTKDMKEIKQMGDIFAGDVRVENLPNRKETFIIFVMNSERKSLTVVSEIKRDADGNVTLSEPIIKEDGVDGIQTMEIKGDIYYSCVRFFEKIK